jgi:hypothetical protein
MVLTTGNVGQTAGEWFLQSGIQEPNGGVARYYYSDRKRNAPLTTEITAYCASALAALYRSSSDLRYLAAAVKAARYLVEAWDAKCSAMPFEREAEDRKHSYFFDNGIIVRGLLTVWRETGAADFLSIAERVGDSMAEDFADSHNFSPILTLPEKSPLAYETARWSRSPGCYQLKAALAWYELSQVTKNERYMPLYRHLLDTSLANHDSFLPGSDTDIPVMDRLHAYSYFLEGLLPAIDDPRCVEAMDEGIERVAGYVYRIGRLFLRSDVLAQLLRLRLFADQLGVTTLDEEAAQREVSLMHEFQSANPEARLKGGFWFGRKNGEILPFMNPVSTAFCYQALEMWNQKGKRELNWQTLI